MAQVFNPPPGWPTPPTGWTPPPGWQPNPAWPAAPDGWRFWIEDPFEIALVQAGQPVSPQTEPAHAASTPTHTMTPPPAPTSLYSYAPSTGLEQPGASPYDPQGHPVAASQLPAAGGGTGAGSSRSPSAPGLQPRNGVAIAVVAVVAILVLGAVVWGALSLVRGGAADDEASGEAAPSAPASTSDAADTEPDGPTDPSPDPTTAPPTTDPATDEPSDDGSGGGVVVDTTAFVDLAGSDPALVHGFSGDPIVEIRLLQAVEGWTSTSPSMFCGDAERGQYLGIQLEFTTLPALAAESSPDYSFIGWELGALADDVQIETNGFTAGMFCVSEAEQPPYDMQPGQTYTGWAVLDVPLNVTAVTFDDPFDWSGAAAAYRWVLAEQ